MSADPQQATRYVTEVPGSNALLDLFVINQHLSELLTRAFDDMEITPSQYAVYSIIGRKSLTPSAIGDLLGVHAPTLSGHLATMEKRGDVHRVRSSTDRRSYTVSLTEAGLARLDRARTRFRRALRATNTALGTGADVAQVRSMLFRLDAAITTAAANL